MSFRREAFVPRLLRGAPSGRAMTLAEHVATHGRALEAAAGELVDACDRSGLLGRGGAGFPTAIKLRSVAARRGRKSVVVNAAEGEPMSGKDRHLVERVPHLVLDGALDAARAVGAREIVVALPDTAHAAHGTMRRAVAERSLGRRVQVALVPDRFLSGEESALVRFLGGGPALPTVVPPRPGERGLHGRPTLVQNAETLAQLALIARHGPAWFRELGTASHPGSTLVTTSGCVRRPGVHEIPVGVELRALLEATGGASEPVRAVLVGGFHGSWLDANALDTTLDRDALGRHGVSLGAGVIVALPGSACPVAEVVATVEWLAGQTARQCGPCVHGLDAIAGQLREIARGQASLSDLARLRRWGGQVVGRGACHHPDGTTRFLLSALTVFEPEFELHRRFGRCEACARPRVLQTPSVQRVAA